VFGIPSEAMLSQKAITLELVKFGAIACPDRSGLHRGWQFESPKETRARWEAAMGAWTWELVGQVQWRVGPMPGGGGIPF